MSKLKFVLVLFLSLMSLLEATTVMEDAEDGTTNGWRIRTGPADGVSNIFDAQSHSRVIQFRGGGSYMLGATHGDNALNITGDTAISWRMRTTREYTFFVIADTREGLRYLFYTFSPNRGLLHGFEGGIHHGLGALTIDGRWRTFTRDLDRDLKDAEPENEIVAINGLMFNGGDGAMIDDVILYTPRERVYENAEDQRTTGWRVSDNSPAGAVIRNIADHDRQGRNLQGRVISLEGAGVRNAYRLGDVDGTNAWNNREQRLLQWRFRDFGPEPEIIDPRGIIRDLLAFSFRVFVQTAQGRRHLLYTLGAEHQGLIGGGTTIHHGLGDDRIRGSVWAGDDPMNELGLWQTITRDLEEDIRDFEPNNRLIAVDGFEVRNSGLVDDIKMLSSVADALNDDNNDDNDDDNNADDVIFEDAEDGNTNGWYVYVNTSGYARIRNVSSASRGSRVINVRGEGRSDGYRFDFNRDAVAHNRLSWSLDYREAFAVFISVETTRGRRYLTYSSRDDSRGLNGRYVLLGLGADAANGRWHTFDRDLDVDLANEEPGNRITRINSFMIRGSGKIDDIVFR